MNKSLVPFLIACVAICPPALAEPDAACANLAAMKWVLGSWRSEVGENTFMEHWDLKDEHTYTGHAEAVDETGGATNFETLRLFEDEGTLVYQADVPQNPGPVDFRLTECSSDSYRFENLEHDFPQVIVYTRLEGGRVEAHIMTAQEDGFRLIFEPYSGDD